MPGPDHTNSHFYHFIHNTLMADKFTASALNMHFGFCSFFVVSSHCAVTVIFPALCCYTLNVFLLRCTVAHKETSPHLTTYVYTAV